MNTIKRIAAAAATAAVLTTGALSLAGPAGAAVRPASHISVAAPDGHGWGT